MKKFFARQMAVCVSRNISQEEIARYRSLLIVEMEKMGATQNEISLIHDATIRNSIRNDRKPEEVAWAILQ
ncbi:MAG: hypothetical protein IJ299_06240 [Oscillospiraceae bacterium]|nr:hypothetical protein [Oscillospiraceae bacterium]